MLVSVHLFRVKVVSTLLRAGIGKLEVSQDLLEGFSLGTIVLHHLVPFIFFNGTTNVAEAFVLIFAVCQCEAVSLEEVDTWGGSLIFMKLGVLF